MPYIISTNSSVENKILVTGCGGLLVLFNLVFTISAIDVTNNRIIRETGKIQTSQLSWIKFKVMWLNVFIITDMVISNDAMARIAVSVFLITLNEWIMT